MKPASAYPSFSIVIETENLAVADPDELIRCLEALEAQDLSPADAKEVLLMESGDVPSTRLEAIRKSYPWMSTVKVDPGTGYYEAKMEGARHVSGEVVVFCDSDCRYDASWLRGLVESFRDPNVGIVGGETALPVTGSYSLALALAWNFPPHSHRRALYRSSGYACNNVAFRRTFLLEHPIPSGLDLYRGNCAMHADECRRRGYAVWRQPRSRALHPVLKRSHFLWRIIVGAHDKVMSYRFSKDRSRGNAGLDWIICFFWVVPKIFLRCLARVPVRLPVVAKNDPGALIYLPLGVFWIFAFYVGTFLGLVLSLLWPSFYNGKRAILLREANPNRVSDG